MKLKPDENLPVTAALVLRAHGFDVDTVRDEGLSGQPDDAVWHATQAEGRFLITQDLDFSDSRQGPAHNKSVESASRRPTRKARIRRNTLCISRIRNTAGGDGSAPIRPTYCAPGPEFTPGTHHGILLVRLPDAEQWRVKDDLFAWLSDPEARSWSRCVVVATPTKVRVRRPAVNHE